MRFLLLTLAVLMAATPLLMGGKDIPTGAVTGSVSGISGLENVVVFVEGIEAPSRASGTYELDQKNKTFIPFVLPVPAGSEVVFLNGDDLLHNVHAYVGKKTIFNWAMPLKGMQLKRRFDEPGDVLLLCDAHSEMEAWIKVVPTPFFAKADASGNFALADVPAGEYTVRAWHPYGKKPQSKTVSVRAGENATVDFEIRK